MFVIPAIDIKGGKCVRLFKGDKNKVMVYSDSPIEMALKWQDCGAKLLHVVDLDGAFEGGSKNFGIIKEIIQAVKIDVQVGGGIRNVKDIEDYIKIGAKKVILGTIIENIEFLKELVFTFGSFIAVSLDERDGFPVIRGWTDRFDMDTMSVISLLEEIGVSTMVYTDVTRDGTLLGPNFSRIKDIIVNTSMNVIVSGGISSLREVRDLADMGAYGVIIGKALYDGRINLCDLGLQGGKLNAYKKNNSLS